MAGPEITLSQLREIQATFDVDNFSGAETPEGKRRHVFLHLGKLLGKAAGVEEQADHGILDTTLLRTDVIPDLLVFAAQLAELEDTDLQQVYEDRLKWVAERNGTGSQSAIDAIRSVE
jgi:hypothetical protein